MKSTKSFRGVTWTDLENPTSAEVMELKERYGLGQEMADDLLSPSARHRVEVEGERANLVLHFPSYKDTVDGDAAYEFDLVVGPDFVITAHYRRLKELESFGHHLETKLAESASEPRNTVFFGIFERLLGDFDTKLAELDHWIREIEKKMFAGSEKKTIFELSETSRHLTDFKKITAVYPEVFKTLAERSQAFGEEFTRLVSELNLTYEKLRTKLDVLSEAVRELRETNDALLTTKSNELMKTLMTLSVATAIIVGIILTWVGLLAVKR